MTAAGLPLIVLIAVPMAAAQVDTATLNATVGSVARLTLSATSISFADADPDSVPDIPATPPAITITAKARAAAGSQITLTAVASDDLRSGLDTIPASQVTWTASGAGFVGGTLSRTAPRTVAAWSGSGVHTGAQSYSFRNLWTYPAGTYTVTVLYTLGAP